MSLPSTNYRDAVQVFFNAQEEGSYITETLATTKNKSESASLDFVSSLAQVAIKGLQQDIQDKNVSPTDLQAMTSAVKNYLNKISPEEKTNKLFSDLFTKIEADIKQLAEPLKMARDSAKADGALTSRNIQKFGIKRQSDLIEIAKLAANQNPEGTSYHIQNYGIKDQHALIEIATLVANQDGGAISQYIENYGIRNEEARIEIAKKAAKQNPEETLLYLKNYDIKDPVALEEITKLATR